MSDLIFLDVVVVTCDFPFPILEACRRSVLRYPCERRDYLN